MKPEALIFANFLAPTLFKTYLHITEHIERYLGLPVCLIAGESEEDFADGTIDGGFVCGLTYVRLAQQKPRPVEVIAAPVLQDARYEHKPRYFSDIVVRADRHIHSLRDLRGTNWAYNQRESHSGYNLMHYTLLDRHYASSPDQFFSHMLESGSHVDSIRMVLSGRADSAAIDSHLLDVLFRNNPQLSDYLRVVETIGPSTMPPFVVSSRLDFELRQKIQDALLSMHRDPAMKSFLNDGLIERFATVADEDYADIRSMYQRVQVQHMLYDLSVH